MTDKQALLNQYKVIADVIDEKYDDLTIRQVKELKVIARGIWACLERRKEERRG